MASISQPSGATRLRLLTIALAPVVSLATAALMLANRTGPPWLGISLLVLLVLTGVGQPIQWLAVALGAVATIMHVFTVSTDGPLTAQWLTASAGLSFLAVGAFAEALGRECTREDHRHLQTALLVEDLTPLDTVAGVTKWTHALHMFERELARARRYRQELALVVVGIERWEEVRDALGPRAAEAVLASVGAHLIASCRVVDIVAVKQSGEFAVLLPDTPAAGAEVVARRITGFRSEHDAARLRAGVASFPTEPDTLTSLISEAEAALALAEQLGKTYVASAPAAQEEVLMGPLAESTSWPSHGHR